MQMRPSIMTFILLRVGLTTKETRHSGCVWFACGITTRAADNSSSVAASGLLCIIYCAEDLLFHSSDCFTTTKQLISASLSHPSSFKQVACMGKVQWLYVGNHRARAGAVQKEGAITRRDYRTIESRAPDPFHADSGALAARSASPCTNTVILPERSTASHPRYGHMDHKPTPRNAYTYV